MKNMIVKALSVLIVGVFILSCDKDKDTLKDAQKYFKQKKYEKALNIFLDYIDTDSSVAQVGAGWCYLRLNDFENADTMFTESAEDSLPDGLAGWSFTAWGLSQLDEAIARAYLVIDKQTDFKMSMDTLVNARQLIWVQAASYYQKGYFDESVERIQQIDPSFNPNMADPDIGNIILAKLEQLGNGQWTKMLLFRKR